MGIDAHMIVECMHSFCKSCIVQYVETKLKKHVCPIMCPVCDASLHPSDPFSDVRSDQTLQDLAYMIVPKLFQRECERRKEFCKKNKIEYRMPKFKTKQGYIPEFNVLLDKLMNIKMHDINDMNETEITDFSEISSRIEVLVGAREPFENFRKNPKSDSQGSTGTTMINTMEESSSEEEEEKEEDNCSRIGG